MAINHFWLEVPWRMLAFCKTLKNMTEDLHSRLHGKIVKMPLENMMFKVFLDGKQMAIKISLYKSM